MEVDVSENSVYTPQRDRLGITIILLGDIAVIILGLRPLYVRSVCLCFNDPSDREEANGPAPPRASNPATLTHAHCPLDSQSAFRDDRAELIATYSKYSRALRAF